MASRRPRPKRLYAKLTKKESAALDSFEADRAAFRISTEPADRSFVEWGIARGTSLRHPPFGPPKIVWVDSPGILGVAGPLAAAILALRPWAIEPTDGRSANEAIDALIRAFAGDGVEGDAVVRAVHAAVDDPLARRAALGPDPSESSYTFDECRVGDDNLIYPFVKEHLLNEVDIAVSRAVTKQLTSELRPRFDRAYDGLVSDAEWQLIGERSRIAMRRGGDTRVDGFVRKVFHRTRSYALAGRAGNVRLRGVTRFLRDVVGPKNYAYPTRFGSAAGWRMRS